MKTCKIIILTIVVVLSFYACKKMSDWDRAMKFYNQGKYERAIVYFQRVREDNPLRRDTSHYLIGESYMKLGKHEKAKEYFSKIIVPQETEELVQYYLQALWEFNAGYYKKSLPYLEVIVHKNPSYKNGQAFFYYIRALRSAEGLKKALETAELGLNILPGHINEDGLFNLYNMYGTLLIDAEDLQNAEKYLKKSLGLKEEPLIHYNLGIIHERTGDMEQAKSHYFQSFILSKDEKSKWKYFNTLSLEEIESNIDFFGFDEKGFGIFKNAVSNFLSGDFEIFRSHIQKTLSMDFKFERLLYQWANYNIRNSKDKLFSANLYHYILGDFNNAVKLYRKLSPEYHSDLNYAIIIFKDGEFEKSREILSRLNGDKDGRKFFYLALIEFNLGNIGNTINNLRKAFEKDEYIISYAYFQSLLDHIASKEEYKELMDFIIKNTKDSELKKWIADNIKN